SRVHAPPEGVDLKDDHSSLLLFGSLEHALHEGRKSKVDHSLNGCDYHALPGLFLCAGRTPGNPSEPSDQEGQDSYTHHRLGNPTPKTTVTLESLTDHTPGP